MIMMIIITCKITHEREKKESPGSPEKLHNDRYGEERKDQ